MKATFFRTAVIFLVSTCLAQGQWQAVNSGLPGGSVVFEMASAEGMFYIGGYGEVLTELLRRTTDDGFTWSVAASGIHLLSDSLWPGVHNMVSHGRSIFLSSSNWIYRVRDNALPWTTVTDTTIIPSGASFAAVDESTMVAISENHVYRTTNQGYLWNKIGLPPTFGLAKVLAKDSVVLAGRTYFLAAGLYRSSNFGATWQLIRQGLPDSFFVNSFLEVDSYVFATGSDNSSPNRPTPFVARSSDKGLTWSTSRIGLANPSGVSAITSVGNTLFAGTGTFSWGGCGVYRSMDFGETWENVSANMPTQFPFVIASLCVHNGYLFAGTEGAGVYRRPLSEILPIRLASFTGAHLGGTRVRLDWRTLSETNNLGFFVERRRASDTTFTQISQLIPGYGTTNEPHDYSFIDSSATINRWYYRLKQVDLDTSLHYVEPIIVDVVTSTGEGDIPETFSLEQNYPNPFNPTTEIRYSAGTYGHASLRVFDVLGREVAALVNETKEPGPHNVLFDGSNLASGIYIYRLTAGSYISAKKMVLAK